MFRIQRVMDDIVPVNREAIRQAQEILQTQFQLLSSKGIDKNFLWIILQESIIVHSPLWNDFTIP